MMAPEYDSILKSMKTALQDGDNESAEIFRLAAIGYKCEVEWLKRQQAAEQKRLHETHDVEAFENEGGAVAPEKN